MSRHKDHARQIKKKSGWIVGLLIGILIPFISGEGISLAEENRGLFSPPAAKIDPEITPLSLWGDFRTQRIEYPSVQAEYGNIVAFYTHPTKREDAPVILILPISNGNYFTESFAIYFAERGFASLRFNSRADLMRVRKNGRAGIAQFGELMRNYVIDIRRGIDWLTNQAHIDPERMGIMGISHGAIAGSLLMGIEPRIKAGAFLLGGGNLAEILLSSQERSIIAMRKKIFEQDGMTSDTLYQHAVSVLASIDPITYADRIQPERVLLINAYFDQVIHRKYAEALWDAMGKPRHVWLPAGHYSAGLFLGYVYNRTIWHFHRVLVEEKGLRDTR